MNKLFAVLGFSGLLLLLAGCSDWLDLRPESEIVLEDYWQNEGEVNQIVAGCYRALTENSVMERLMVWGELRSDNVISTGDSDMPEDMGKLFSGNITIGNGYAVWGPIYSVINYCNIFLHYAPDVVERDENFTMADFNSLKAEVLTIRALSYFYLVRTFKEVPWIEDASIADNQDYRIPKSSEDFVLDKLIEDLKFAERYSRDQFETDLLSKARITRSAVRALMADIYIWRGEYEQSIIYCDKVLADPNLELVEGEDVLQEVFYLGNSSESIFELQFNREIQENKWVKDNYGNANDIDGYWAFPFILVNGDYRIFNLSSGGVDESIQDLRRYDFLYNYLGDSYNIFKYAGALRVEVSENVNQYVYGSREPNWIIYRLSDIMLLKAEALVQLNDLEEALEMVNTTYLRSSFAANPQPLLIASYGTQREMENLVLRERQRELMFEGKRWFDLMRLARRENSPSTLVTIISRKQGGAGSSGGQNLRLTVMDALYLPIHVDELNSNSALVQNPYYEIESGSITK